MEFDWNVGDKDFKFPALDSASLSSVSLFLTGDAYLLGNNLVNSAPFDSANPDGNISVELKGRTRIRSSEIWIQIKGGVILITIKID